VWAIGVFGELSETLPIKQNRFVFETPHGNNGLWITVKHRINFKDISVWLGNKVINLSPRLASKRRALRQLMATHNCIQKLS
jgi:hypothetical protein